MQWSDVAELFVWDGSMRDIYVEGDADLVLWQNVLDSLRRSEYLLTYYLDGEKSAEISLYNADEFFAKQQEASVLLAAMVGPLTIHCHLFTPDEIEFDIDPREVKDETSFASLEAFLRWLGQTTKRRVIVRDEGGQDFCALLRYDPVTDRMDAVNLSPELLLRNAYAAFNGRHIETVLSIMRPDVEWPNGMEGGYVYGHAGVREYWTRQWEMVDPHVEPTGFMTLPDGRTAVEVRQIVRDLSGNVLVDGTVRHVYEFKDGLVRRMEIIP